MKKSSTLVVYVCLIHICLLTTTTEAEEQRENSKNKDKEPEISTTAKKYGYFSSQNWCADETTVTFNKDRDLLSGLRFIFEPNFGTLIQFGENEFDDTIFPNLSKFALETNVHKGWAAFQFGVVSPSTIKFDTASPNVKNKDLVSPEGTTKVKVGLTGGFSFIDGWLSVGIGCLWYKKSSFVDSYKGNHHDSFLFFNLQPVSLIRSTIKAVQAIED